MFFNGDDVVPTLVITYAGHEVLRWLAIKENIQTNVTLESVIKARGLSEQKWWKEFNQVYNFFKHSNFDHDDTFEISEKDLIAHIDWSLWFAVVTYEVLTGQMTDKMSNFHEWTIFRYASFHPKNIQKKVKKAGLWDFQKLSHKEAIKAWRVTGKNIK